MPLRLYDTLTREKRPFVPIDSSNVRIYGLERLLLASERIVEPERHE